MPTRSETRETSLGYVLQCEIEEDLSSAIAIRKNNKWFYVSVKPGDIDDDHLRGQYERRAAACRRQQIAYERLCNDEEDDQDESKDGKTASSNQDSGYSSDEPSVDDDAEDTFRDWVQEPMHEIFSKHAPGEQRQNDLSLQDWYDADIFCFSLRASDKDTHLQPTPLTDVDAKAFLHSALIPNMTIPKYIHSRKDIHFYAPSSITVLSESHDIHMPLHPTTVRLRAGEGDGSYRDCFLKLAAEEQEPAVKREIALLADFKKKDLYGAGLRAPTLEGLVTLPSSPSSHTKILGFLLSHIPQPCRPLTKLMSSEIPANKRQKWAREVQKQVEILHKHDFLWGDVKADNFLVDREDEVWMIDFGGSYTVGWMDGRTYGTRKGEKEVMELIARGVKDPDGCAEIDGLLGETDEKTPSQTEEAKKVKARESREATKGAKRKVDQDEGIGNESEANSKKRRQ